MPNSDAPKPSYAELEAICLELQQEVSRFMSVEQKLIRTKDSLDFENARFKLIQSYGERAIREADLAGLARVTAEGVLEVFDTEVGMLLEVSKDRKQASVVSCCGLEAPAGPLPFEIPIADRNGGTVLLDESDPALQAWSGLGFAQAMASPIFDEDKSLTHVLVAARTKGNADFYRPYMPEVLSSLSIMSKQVQALMQNLSSRQVIQRQIDELREMDRLKDQFLANTSHELRTPLNAIIGLAENIIEGIDGPVNPSQLKHLNMVTASGHRLLGLVNSIMDYSKLHAGMLEVEPEMLNLSEFLKTQAFDILEDWREENGVLVSKVRGLRTPLAAKRQNLKIYCRTPADLPAVYSDPGRLQQIMLNLLSNAIKFTLQGSIVISARAANDDFVEVEVRDTGVGIPAGELDRIFEEFYQVDGSERRSFEGTGLGLSIVKRMIEAIGGSVRVESLVGVGSAFTISIPRRKELASPRPPPPKERAPVLEPLVAKAPLPANLSPVLSPASSADSSGGAALTEASKEGQATDAKFALRAEDAKGKTIVVVDDEAANIEVLAMRLEAKGFKVASFEGAVEAFEHLQASRPDIILSDVMMPSVTGYDLCRMVRMEPALSDVPFVFLSAKVRPEDKAKGLELGANDYLEKPVSSQALFECLHGLIKRMPELSGAESDAAPSARVDLSGRGESIVIVDDEPANIEVLEAKLRAKNYRVTSFVDAREALRFLDEAPVDLIISDVMMPDVSGYDFCRELRKREAHVSTPLIFLTAKQRIEDLVQGLAAGADDYLTKPLNSAELYARVMTHLRILRLQREYVEKLRMQRELAIAGLLQKLFLPVGRPSALGRNYSSWYEPASEAGGDLFGYIDLAREDECLLYVGDVTGHGVNAALVTAYVASYFAVLRRCIKDPSAPSLEPEAILAKLNRHLFDLGRGQQCMTFVAGIYNKTENILRLSTAGHPLPIVYRRAIVDGKCERRAVRMPDAPSSTILGLGPDASFDRAVWQLQPDDLVLMCTDGLLECRNPAGRSFGDRRLAEQIRDCGDVGVAELLEKLASEMRDFRGPAALDDDITVVAFKA